MTRTEAAEYIPCSLSKLYQMEKGGLMDGTFYEIGTGERRRRIYITERLDEWIMQGGEPAAMERLHSPAPTLRAVK